MKRTFLALFFLAVLGAGAIGEEPVLLPRNGISVYVNDLLKIDLSSLFGNVGCSTVIGRNLRLDVGLSGSYATELDVSANKNALTTTRGLGGEIALVYIDEGSAIAPFLGLGFYAGFSQTIRSESSAAGNQDYADDMLTLSAFLPFGVEVRITDRYRIGIMEKFLCSKAVDTKAATSVDGATSRDRVTAYGLDFGSPLVYFSIWL